MPEDKALFAFTNACDRTLLERVFSYFFDKSMVLFDNIIQIFNLAYIDHSGKPSQNLSVLGSYFSVFSKFRAYLSCSLNFQVTFYCLLGASHPHTALPPLGFALNTRQNCPIALYPR
jgi:hypothetical protein